MSIKTLLRRVKMLERVLTPPHAEQRTYDVRVLNTEQRGYVTEAARMMTAIRDGSMVMTDERDAFIRAGMLLLSSCPPLPEVTH